MVYIGKELADVCLVVTYYYYGLINFPVMLWKSVCAYAVACMFIDIFQVMP